jgi:hypothetical protein
LLRVEADFEFSDRGIVESSIEPGNLQVKRFSSSRADVSAETGIVTVMESRQDVRIDIELCVGSDSSSSSGVRSGRK